MPDPHLRMAEMTLSQPVTSAPPDAIAGIATQFILKDLVEGRVTFLVAFTFAGTRGRVWQLHEVIPADEVVRAIAEREQAEAVVVVHPLPVPPEVDGERCVNIAAEAEGGKFDNLVAFKQGPQGEMFRIYRRRHTGDVHYRWLGVPPEGEVDVWFEGIVGAIGSTKGETLPQSEEKPKEHVPEHDQPTHPGDDHDDRLARAASQPPLPRVQGVDVSV